MTQSTIPERGRRTGLLGDLPDFQERPLELMLELANEHSPLTKLRFGPTSQYVVSDPDGAKEVLQRRSRHYIKEQQMMNVTRTVLKSGRNLFTSDGDDWLKRRRAMQPAFHRKMVADFSDVIVREADRATADWSEGQWVDIEQVMMAATLAIIGQTMLSRDILTDHPYLYHAFETASEHIIHRATTVSGRLTPQFLPTAKNRAFQKAVALVRNVLSTAVGGRKEIPIDERPHDLLTMLLAARDHESGFTLSDNQLMDELYGIVTAGHETSSITLAALFYELAHHPEVSQKARAEIDTVLAGRSPTAADVANLPFLNHCLAETMRRYPAAYVTTRQTIEEEALMGYKIPAGGSVLINIYGLHHHLAYWVEPLRFDPERWERDDINIDAYLPFGAGPRKCIGEPLARLEMALIAAAILQKYRFQPDPNRPMKVRARFTLRAAEGIWLRVKS